MRWSPEVVLEDVRVRPEAPIDAEGARFRVAMTPIERGRLGVASRAVGPAQLCLEHSFACANECVVFDQPIAEFQLTQRRTAMLVTGIEASLSMVRRCAEACSAMNDRGWKHQ